MTYLDEMKQQAMSKTSKKSKERKKRNFDTLLTCAFSKPHPSQWVVNRSLRPLSSPEKRVLAAVEDGLRRTNPTLIQTARTRIVGILNHAKPPQTNLLLDETRAISDLKNG